jgi:hypothetical protein
MKITNFIKHLQQWLISIERNDGDNKNIDKHIKITVMKDIDMEF